MVPIWWAWTGHTLFSTRFDTEDSGQKLLTLTQMLAVLFWATFINADFAPYYLGYLLFYVLIRILLILMYWRATKINPRSIPIAKRLGFGFSIGLLVALSSLLFESPLRYFALYLGIGIEIITPLVSRKVLRTVPVESHHLPERFGLLGIILLGESVMMMATKFNDVPWSVYTTISAILGFVILSTIWWLYFDLMERYTIGKKLKTGQHIIYGHLFIYLGLSAIAVFIGFSIEPELTLFHHWLLLCFGFINLFVGLSITFGVKAILEKKQMMQFVIIFLTMNIVLVLNLIF